MQLVKGNSRSTIPIQGDHQTKILVLNNHFLKSKTIIYVLDIDLDCGETSQEQVRRYPFMNLGALIRLQSHRHTRGKQHCDKLLALSTMQLHGICSALGQAASIHRYYIDYWSYNKLSHTHSELFRRQLIPHCTATTILLQVTVYVDTVRFPQLNCNSIMWQVKFLELPNSWDIPQIIILYSFDLPLSPLVNCTLLTSQIQLM